MEVNPALRKGLNVTGGRVVNPAVAEAFQLDVQTMT